MKKKNENTSACSEKYSIIHLILIKYTPGIIMCGVCMFRINVNQQILLTVTGER